MLTFGWEEILFCSKRTKRTYIYIWHDLCYVKACWFQHRLDGKLHGSCLSNKINHTYLLYISVKWRKHNIKIEIFSLVINKGGEIRKKLKNTLHLNESWNKMKLIYIEFSNNLIFFWEHLHYCCVYCYHNNFKSHALNIMIFRFIFDFFLKFTLGISTLSPPKIIITSIIFVQLLFLVMYGHHILDSFCLF
jgi:hypothetical protein